MLELYKDHTASSTSSSSSLSTSSSSSKSSPMCELIHTLSSFPRVTKESNGTRRRPTKVAPTSITLMVLVALVFMFLVSDVRGDCSMLNNCNGHGTCVDATSTCSCFEGWGAERDITFYHAPDCSARTCPSGRAWADVPTSSTNAHAYAECSNRGSCDRKTGTCNCFDGFTGPACNR